MWWMWFKTPVGWRTMPEPLEATNALEAEREACMYGRMNNCAVRWRDMSAFLGPFETFLEDDAKQGD